MITYNSNQNINYLVARSMLPLKCLLIGTLSLIVRYFANGQQSCHLPSILTNLSWIICHYASKQGFPQVFKFSVGIIACLFPFWVFIVENFQIINLEGMYVIPIAVISITHSGKLTLFVAVVILTMTNYVNKGLLLEYGMQISTEELIEKVYEMLNSSMVIVVACIIYQHEAFNTLNKQAAQSESEVQTSFQNLKKFIHSFSHEIRNPLNCLIGSLDLAAEEKLSSAAEEMIDVAKNSSQLLLQLLNNILDSGKAELGNLEVHPTPTKFHELISKVWGIGCEIVKKKDLMPILYISRNVPSLLKLDSCRITQILLNLIGNATKFTDKGTIDLTIDWIHDEEKVTNEAFMPEPFHQEEEAVFEKNSHSKRSSTYYQLSSLKKQFTQKEIEIEKPKVNKKGLLKIIITDTGIGIDRAAMDNLYQRFSQHSHSTERNQMGTGLGLYLIKEIVNKMNGEIRAYSKVGVGTTFIVCIPTFYCSSFMDVPRDDQAIEYLQEKKLRCLIVDDAGFNLTLLEDYLNRINASEILKASNGEEAYSIYKENLRKGKKFDLIVSDVDMPKMNGPSLCKKIRDYEKEKRLPSVRIIMATGNDNPMYMRNLLNPEGEYKISRYILKPISSHAFIETVAHSIQSDRV